MTVYIQTTAEITALSGAPLLIDYDADLGAEATTAEWWHPDDGYVTPSSGAISDITSQKASGGQTLSQATAGSQAALVASAINGRNALRFTRTSGQSPDRYPMTFPASASLSWTKILVLREYLGAPIIGGNLWSSGNVAGRHLLSHAATTGVITHRCGVSPDEAVITVTPDDWQSFFLLMASFDHLTGTAAISLNGSVWSTNTDATAFVDETACTLGATLADSTGSGPSVDIAMAGIDSAALHLSAHSAKLEVWKQLVRDDFGLTIA